MKLSRTAWNNVIIFAVMGLILIINLTHEELNPSDPANSNDIALLAEHQYILTLAVNQEFLIERIGKTWRASPEKLNQQAIEQMVIAWQQSSGVQAAQAPHVLPENATQVTIEVAGEQQAKQFSVYLFNQELFAFDHQKQVWLQLPKPLYQQLLPAAIFFE